MKTLNELTPKERLELYKKALVDWTERPDDKDEKTTWGLCFYIEKKHKTFCQDWLDINECAEFNKNITDVALGYFLGNPGDPIPRIAALKAMIKELEEAQ